MVSGLAEGADAASKALQAAQKIAAFASYACEYWAALPIGSLVQMAARV